MTYVNGRLNREKIEKLCKLHNYKYKILGDKILISSMLDEWCAVVEDHKKIVLYHSNGTKRVKGKNKSSHRHHQQRIYRDLEYMFESIRKHDNWKLNKDYKKHKRIDDLFKKIK